MAGRAGRWVLAAVGAAAGFYLALSWLGRLSQTYPLPLQPLQAAEVAAGGVLLGAVFGHQLGPLAVRGLWGGLRLVERRLAQTPALDLLAGTGGVVVGLVIAFLLSPALARLPWYGRGLITIVCGYLGAALFLGRREDWLRLWAGRGAGAAGAPGAADVGGLADGRPKILDTSAIIDGRVADLFETGFLEGRLIVPTGVLDELRHMADSGDDLRRQRGRFGLEVLGNLQKERHAPVVFETRDPDPEADVDTKLVLLAKECGGHVVTVDFNLNKVAELQGVSVLNVNALANALRPRYLPDEELSVRIVNAGRQPGQGVGYLRDGTMVLVEGAKQYLHVEVPIVVTSVIQNQQGRMIFGRLRVPDGVSGGQPEAPVEAEARRARRER